VGWLLPQAARGNKLTFPSYRAWEPHAFVQDDWRAKPWLTLNLGLRYDIFTPFTERFGDLSNFDPAIGLLIGPDLPGIQKSGSTMGVHTDLGDVAPRVGFALSLKHGMVVRGGFGMSYWPGNTSGNSLGQNAPFTGNFGCGEEPYSAQPCTGQFSAGNGRSLLSAGMPPPPYGVLNDALATNPANYLGTALLSVEPNFRASYVEQYSLQFEKEIAGNILSIGYVGNQGRRVVNYPNINQPGTSTSPYPFPALPGVTIQWWSSAGNTQYNAMQLSLQRRLSHGLTASANYTYSSATGNISVSGESQGGENLDCAVFTCLEDNPANPSEPKIVKGWQQYDQGNSDIDVTSRFTTMINYQLPITVRQESKGSRCTGRKGVGS
jgi:outer membrane receptor protein involved in Fe transport